jgi:hypothetical protein
MATLRQVELSVADLPAYDVEVNPTEQSERLSYLLCEALLDVGTVDFLMPNGEESEGEWALNFYSDLIEHRPSSSLTGFGVEKLLNFIDLVQAVLRQETLLGSILSALETLTIQVMDEGALVEAVKDVAAASGVVIDSPGLIMMDGMTQVNGSL